MEANEILERASVLFKDDDKMLTWLSALVSGEYEQSQYKLYDGNNGFCCIGVLAKEVIGVRLRDIASPREEDNKRVHIKGSYLDAQNLLIQRNLHSDDYITANDGGFTFQQIAEGIVLDKEFRDLLDKYFPPSNETSDRWLREDEYFDMGFDLEHKADCLARLKKEIEHEVQS